MSAAYRQMLADVAAQRDRLQSVLQGLVDADETPSPNCSCHLSSPCDDCVENSHRRELISAAKSALAACTPVDGQLAELSVEADEPAPLQAVEATPPADAAWIGAALATQQQPIPTVPVDGVLFRAAGMS